jgi:hypothetical protein
LIRSLLRSLKVVDWKKLRAAVDIVERYGDPAAIPETLAVVQRVYTALGGGMEAVTPERATSPSSAAAAPAPRR